MAVMTSCYNRTCSFTLTTKHDMGPDSMDVERGREMLLNSAGGGGGNDIRLKGKKTQSSPVFLSLL
jgi:hypothetical protein